MKKSILIVDDVEANIDVLVELLSDKYDIIVSTDGASAIELANTEEIDLILLDIMMPNIDGYEVCKILKENKNTAEIPIIFLTAKSEESSIEKAYEVGGVDYISKPFKPKELLARISTHLELRDYQCKLEDKIRDASEKHRIQEALLYQKSKQSALGELLMHIAHQWKQPLMELASIHIFCESAIRLQKETREFLLKNLSKSSEVIQFMSNTISVFENFYTNSNEKVLFSLTESIKVTTNILSATMNYNSIDLSMELEDVKFFGISNEFSQIILNILNNSKNAFIKRNIRNRAIHITLKKESDILISIEDNAGGVELDILDNIFEPFLSDKGTGVGLYISKTLLERYNGEIIVKNTTNGAIFYIKLPNPNLSKG